MIDLDELEEIETRIPFFSHNAANIYSFRDDDHLFLGKDTLKENLDAYLNEQGLPSANKATILTGLRTFGHVFNPVSFLFCYDSDDHLYAIVAEVHNTFGELKPFLVKEPKTNRQAFEALHDKYFYISPFSDLDHKLELKLFPPDEKLRLFVSNRENGQEKKFFQASLTGCREKLTTLSLFTYSLRFPFVTLRIVFLIHWHALRIWRRGLQARSKKANPGKQRGILPKRHQLNKTTESIAS